ncbi:MAG: preprotein translocase subunit SecE [Clostridiaceae bacterium]|jgi:preprotein translocase subunit SecE|nr:preprotein translocase subunit SecE [Clostridiaceae bacterium]
MSDQKLKFGQRVGKFFKDIRMEIKKVIWPTRKQLINNTIIVFIACIAIGIVIWGADTLLGYIFSAVFGQ